MNVAALVVGWVVLLVSAAAAVAGLVVWTIEVVLRRWRMVNRFAHFVEAMPRDPWSVRIATLREVRDMLTSAPSMPEARRRIGQRIADMDR